MPNQKLTPTQQEVVNLMAAGWTLRFVTGSGMSDALFLSKGTDSRRVNKSLRWQLRDKGVIEEKIFDWRRAYYILTPQGKALAAFNAREQ